MTTTTNITIDIANRTATDTFILNGMTVTNILLAKDQITFNTRDGLSLSLSDFQMVCNQLLTFQASIELNGLSPAYGSLGVANFSLSRNDHVNCLYSFLSGTNSIEDFSYDYTTKLCTIKKRSASVTVSYSAWLANLSNTQRYIKELSY